MHRRPALAGIVLVGLLLATPLAGAAHEHAHRYVVVGRVLGADDRPAEKVPVRVELTGTAEPVAAQATDTNCKGDFVAVFPAGNVGAASVRVTVNQERFTREADPVFRRSFVPVTVNATLHDPDCADTRRNFTEGHLVLGRLLDPDREPRQGVNVTVQLLFDGGEQINGTGVTNQAGDYAIGFRSQDMANASMALLAAEGVREREPLDTRYGVTVIDHLAERELWAPGPSLLGAALAGLVAAGARRGLRGGGRGPP